MTIVDFTAATLVTAWRELDFASHNTAPSPLRHDPPFTLVPDALDRRSPVPVHQPQPHQVALQIRLVVVLVRGAVVQHRAVVEQGRLAAFELEAHPEFGVGGQALEGGFDAPRGSRR